MRRSARGYSPSAMGTSASPAQYFVARGFCLAAAEAASVGTPCIVSDVGGLPETVEHNVTGLVVPKEDIDSLVRSVKRLILDRDLWSRLSRQAYERSRVKFGFERCVDSYAAAYRDVSEGSKKGQRCGIT